jgi:hypothetical protein
MYHWQRLETPAGCLYVQAPRCLSFTLIGWAVVAKWRLFGGDDEGYDSWRHHERSPRTPIFIPGRKTKQSRRTRRFLVAIDPPNRKSSPPDGDDFPLWCNKLWGASGERLGRAGERLWCRQPYAYRKPNPEVTFPGKIPAARVLPGHIAICVEKNIPGDWCWSNESCSLSPYQSELGFCPQSHFLYE